MQWGRWRVSRKHCLSADVLRKELRACLRRKPWRRVVRSRVPGGAQKIREQRISEQPRPLETLAPASFPRGLLSPALAEEKGSMVARIV